MCGRFALATPPEDLRQLVDFSNRVNFPPRYNIAPTQPVSIIRAVPGREMALVQWGLIAPWLKPEQVGDKSRARKLMRGLRRLPKSPVSKMLFAAAAVSFRRTGFMNGIASLASPIAFTAPMSSRFSWPRFGRFGTVPMAAKLKVAPLSPRRPMTV